MFSACRERLRGSALLYWTKHAAPLALVMICLACPEPLAPPPSGTANSFSASIAPILGQCTSCHRLQDEGQEPAGGLVLEAQVAYGNLVNVRSTQAPDMDLVEPGRPDQSYLVHKITGSQSTVGGSGTQMPATQLSDREITLIQSWIIEGAKP